MRPLALVLLALLLAAAPARAAGTLTPYDTRPGIGGVHFAGDRLAWATYGEAPGSAEVHVAAPDGSGHATQEIKPAKFVIADRRSFGMAASERRVAAGMHVGYYTSRKGGSFVVEYSQSLTGAIGSPLETFGSACSYEWVPLTYAVDGEVVAESACGDAVTVRDFGGGGEPVVLKHRGVHRLSLAGEYLALAGGGLTLVRWRTGEVVLRIPWVYTQSFDVQEDGTVAFVPELGLGRPRPVFVSSPAEPRVRTLDEGPAGTVRVARDRVALATPEGARVRALDGSVVSEAAGAAVGDFDGERLAWARRPCGVLFIATWDLRDAVPAPPAAPCPTPALRSTKLRATVRDFSEAVTVKLECPPEPALGCAGQVTLFARDSRAKPNLRGREVDMAWAGYALMPGERRELTMPYQKRRVCIAGRNGLRPVVQLSGASGVPGDEAPRVERRRVRVVGLDEAVERCSA